MKISAEVRRHIIVASAFSAVIAASILGGYLLSFLPTIEEKCTEQCHAPSMEGHMVHVYPAAMTAGMQGKGPRECKCFRPGTFNPSAQ